jgi:hypothetical protein
MSGWMNGNPKEKPAAGLDASRDDPAGRLGFNRRRLRREIASLGFGKQRLLRCQSQPNLQFGLPRATGQAQAAV